MTAKTIKIQLEDEIIEYNIEENQSIVLDVQNINDELKISKRNNSEITKEKQTEEGLFDSDYVVKHHETSIYDVLNNNLKDDSVASEEKEDDSEISVKEHNNFDDYTEGSQQESLVDSVKAQQKKIEESNPSSYENMISNALERFKQEEKQIKS